MTWLQQMTALGIEATFPDEDACKAYLASRRWPDQVRCPRCSNTKIYPLRGFTWQCHACHPKGYRFSVLVGTVFENTKIPLRDWFRAMHLMLTKSKVTIVELQHHLGLGSNRSAWLLSRRIRTALNDNEFRKLVGLDDPNEAGEQQSPPAHEPQSPESMHAAE